MSLKDGMAAINLEMPDRVPRTEYSADQHWDLVNAVAGTSVGPLSPEADRAAASRAFREAWDYSFQWSIMVEKSIFGDKRTRMGHAVYASGGVDYDADLGSPFEEPEEVLSFDPWEAFGERDVRGIARQFESHYRMNREATPDCVNMTGIYVTMVSGFIDLFGWDLLLMAAGLDPKGFGAMANRYASWIKQYFDALALADVPVVMIHDDIVWTEGAIFRPEWYREFIFPNYAKLFAPLREAGKKIMYTSDGNYTEFVDDVAETGVHGFVLEPLTDMEYIARKYGKTHAIIGNADTRILLSGTKEDIRAEVKRCMDIGKPCPGFFMAVGNHIPSNTPVANCLVYNDAYLEMSRR